MTNLIGKRVAAFAQLGTSLAAIAAASMVVAPSAAVAQTGTSTLHGQTTAGVEVVAREVDTGEVRRVTADSQGAYTLAGLQPGGYHVVAGDQSSDIVIAVASNQVLDLLPPAAAAESSRDVVVTGSRPTADTRSSSVNQYVTLHDIAALPQATRNFLEFADTIPGVQFTQEQGANTSLRGGAQLDSAVNVYIDGVDQKDYVGSGGGTSGSGSGFTGSGGVNGNGDPGNPFPQLAIGEYQVVTSNYSAEYGDASSAIIIAQTKSGTNDFHGEGFFDFDNSALRKEYPSEEAAGLGKSKASNKEYGVAIGGPIIKDMAHFFFTWEHKSLSDETSVYANGLVPASAIALLPSNIQSQIGPVTNPFTENLYFGKIDLEPSSRDRFEVTGYLRIEDNIEGAGGQNAVSTEVPYVNDVKRVDGRWQHNGEHVVNTFRISYQDAKSAAQTTVASPQFDYTYFPNAVTAADSNQDSASIINVGGPGAGVGTINQQKGFTFADDATFSDIHFAGDHTILAGASFGSINLTTQNASSDLANATYYFAVTPAGVAATPYQVQYPNLTNGFNTTQVRTRDKQYSAYVQDNWDISPRLELNLGLRWDHEVVPAYLNFHTPANVVAAINGPYCIAVSPQPCTTTQSYGSVLATNEPGAPAININDYLSNGSNRKARENFSPRVGFTYDFSGNNSFVLFGGYARAYNRNLFSTLALETTKIALNSNPQVFFPSAETEAFGPCRTNADVNPTNHCYAFDPAYLTPAGLATLETAPNSHEVDLLNNDLKTPYSDQYSLGIRNRLGEWNTQATVSYVASFDGIYGHWGARYQNGQFYQNGVQWGAQGVPGVGSLILFDNGFKDHDLQFSLAAQKPYTKASHWSATASYTFSAARQNNSYAYGAAGNTYLFDYPIVGDYPVLPSTAVPRHRLVLTGTVDVPFDIQFAAKLSLATTQSAAAIYGCSQYVAGCSPNTAADGSTYYTNSIGGSTGGIATFKPNGLIGYKDLDIQLTKNLNFFHRLDAYVRADVLNVFNWHNYDPLAIIINSTNGVPTSAQFNKTGPIVGVPLTLKLTAGVKF